jgi:hypothetical protein
MTCLWTDHNTDHTAAQAVDAWAKAAQAVDAWAKETFGWARPWVWTCERTREFRMQEGVLGYAVRLFNGRWTIYLLP